MSIFESIKEICEMGREHFPELDKEIDEAEDAWDKLEQNVNELAKKQKEKEED